MAVCSLCSTAFCDLSLWRRAQHRPCRTAAGGVYCRGRPVKQTPPQTRILIGEDAVKTGACPALTLTLVCSIWAVGMVSVTNSPVSCTVKRSVWFTDTLLTVSTSGSWLPRLVRPMCLFKMCSTMSSLMEVATITRGKMSSRVCAFISIDYC